MKKLNVYVAPNRLFACFDKRGHKRKFFGVNIKLNIGIRITKKIFHLYFEKLEYALGNRFFRSYP